MTGTSIDALDAALVAIDGTGLAMKASVVRCLSRPLGELADCLRGLAEQQLTSAGDVAWVSHALSGLHTEVLCELIAADRLDLVAVHGQTVYHNPPISWQLVTPTPIAHQLGVPVVFDLRAADLAVGGRGAPITPIADFVLFRAPDETRVIVNLGGYVNYTLLPREPAGASVSAVRGGDICACNQVLDALARRVFGEAFDQDGQRAWTGRVRAEAFNELVALLGAQMSSNRALGTGDELTEWIDTHWESFVGEDLARSACEAIAEVVTRRALADVSADRLLLAGGGTRNRALMDALCERCEVASLTDEVGVSAPYREAVAVAVLGALCQDRVPITLPQVTGARGRPPVAGSWAYPMDAPPSEDRR
jgi:1,6-anhydro-N-acetylmuramate kinase